MATSDRGREPIRCPCLRTQPLAYRLVDGTVEVSVRIGRTKGRRVLLDPRAIVCDACGAVWQPEPIPMAAAG